MNSQSNDKPEEVAILGGGVAGMTAALMLTDPENPKSGKYRVTVYQQGWRLGGKGASGRNSTESQRIEEHGLHVWLGFYENAFRAMRKTYTEWNIPEGHPWGAGPAEDRWKHAFKGGDYTPLTEHTKSGARNSGEEDCNSSKNTKGDWTVWPISFPVRSGEPGDGEDNFSIWKILRDLRDWLHQVLGLVATSTGAGLVPEELDHHVVHHWQGGQGTTPPNVTMVDEAKKAHHHVGKLCDTALLLEKPLGCIGKSVFFLNLGWRLFQAKRHVKKVLSLPEVGVTRMLSVVIDILYAVLHGLLKNLFTILRDGFDALDDTEFRDWLQRYGASKSAAYSPLIGALYNGAFGAKAGQTTPEGEDMAAGTALRAFLRITTGYKGHNYWRMQAGMGDTVFTPMYQVLKARDVKFQFLHRATKIARDAKGRVRSVNFARQATLIDGIEEYSPLVDVPFVNLETNRPFSNPLGCWPSELHYGQVEQGRELQKMKTENNVDLENPRYTEYYKDPGCFTLVDRRSISDQTAPDTQPVDHIIYAMPVATLPQVAADLLEPNTPLWKTSRHVETVRTLAYQLWINRLDRVELGFDVRPEKDPILTNFRNPLNTWADLTHLHVAEEFQPSPKHIAYFCGPMRDDISEEDVAGYVREQSRATQNEMAASLWPNAENVEGEFDRSLVVSEYFRTNTSPSERYTLSVTNSTCYRLWPDESGFDNLTLAGDWTNNGLNIGSVEATVMSGMLASSAISGYPRKSSIIGANGP